jgi:hypothetical protein
MAEPFANLPEHFANFVILRNLPEPSTNLVVLSPDVFHRGVGSAFVFGTAAEKGNADSSLQKAGSE